MWKLEILQYKLFLHHLFSKSHLVSWNLTWVGLCLDFISYIAILIPFELVYSCLCYSNYLKVITNIKSLAVQIIQTPLSFGSHTVTRNMKWVDLCLDFISGIFLQLMRNLFMECKHACFHCVCLQLPWTDQMKSYSQLARNNESPMERN